MPARDLRTGPPLRWNVAVDGVVWLPRFAGKARAFDAGTLGDYLYGQSPVDDAFLRAARLDYAAFLEIVRSAPDDAGVLAAIERASPGSTDRLRRWSARLPRRAMLLLYYIDLDDGYSSPPWMRVAGPVVRGSALVASRLLRAMRPSVKRT